MDYYHLVCVHPFGKYTRGQMVTEPDEVAMLLDDREHHFVRIAIPAAFPDAAFVTPAQFAGVEDEPKPVPKGKGG